MRHADGRSMKHYRDVLYTSRTVIYHMGAPVTPAAASRPVIADADHVELRRPRPVFCP